MAFPKPTIVSITAANEMEMVSIHVPNVKQKRTHAGFVNGTTLCIEYMDRGKALQF